MRISINPHKWYDGLWAAMMFFTRLPLKRIHRPPRSSYASVIEYWPLTGWVTGGVMAATVYWGSMVMPYPAAIVLAIALRVTVTGGMHESALSALLNSLCRTARNRQDGTRDNSGQGLGGIGTTGVVLYELALVMVLMSLPAELAAITIAAADPYAKMLSGQLTTMMPYACTAELADGSIALRRLSVKSGVWLAIQGLTPLAAYLYIIRYIESDWQMIVFTPCLVMYGLYLLVRKRPCFLSADTCGAIFLPVELSLYIAVRCIL